MKLNNTLLEFGCFNMRRAFIAKVNRGLERVLRVSEEPEEVESDLPLTPEQLAAQEQEEQYNQLARRTAQIAELRRLVLALPRGLRAIYRHNPAVVRIRELLNGLNLATLPADLADLINELPL